MSIYRRLFDEVRPHWKLVLGSVGFSIMMAALELMPSILTKSLIDDAIYKKNMQLLYVLSALLMVMLIARTIAHYSRMIYTGKLAQLVLFQLRTKLYEHLQTLSMSFYSNKR